MRIKERIKMLNMLKQSKTLHDHDIPFVDALIQDAKDKQHALQVTNNVIIGMLLILAGFVAGVLV